MIILGVDPGTLITGYGVIEQVADRRSGTRGTFRVLEYDYVQNRSNLSMPFRLQAIYKRLCEVIDRHHPDEFAIETAFYGKNAQSALKIGHARGVSILAAVNREIPTAEYSPREVKKAVVGNGAASKEQVQFMVRSILRLRATPRFYDTTDALAVALCHFNSRAKPTSQATDKRKKPVHSKQWNEFLRAHPERVLK
jgi:crossover junction endodeoxyribonuclease RuvC